MVVNQALVERYIQAASAIAKSNIEQQAIAEARRLNSLEPRIKPRITERIEIEAAAAPEHEEWKHLVLLELHSAFCKRSKKYAKEVNALASNANLLIGAIAGYVAAAVGVEVAIIAALVAALLRFIVAVGVSIFCRKGADALAL